MIGKKLIIALACCSAALFVTAAATLPFTTLIKKDETHEASEYTITFESNKGTTVNSISITGGSKATKPTDPKLKNYIFKGWFTDVDCSDGNEFDFENDVIDGNITLYAKWELADQFYISFDSQQGSFVDEVQVTKGGKITKPTDPTREGYVFAGWYLDKECSESKSWDFENNAIDIPITLYAKWEPKGNTPDDPIDPDKPVTKYTVNYDSLGGSDVDSVTDLATGSKLSKPSDPTREGYRFVDWYKTNPETDSNAVVWNFETDTVTATMTLYAKWEQVYFDIQYVTEHGIKPQTIFTDKLPDTLDVLTERGYVFCGWYLEESYENKAVAGSPIDQDTTLYAKWRIKNKYDELLEQPDFVIAHDDFDNYKADDRLPVFTSWDIAGIYYDTHKGSSSTVEPSDTTTYIQMDKGVAELVDASNGASIQLVLASGKLESGIIEGYFEATLKSSGNSWTFFQLYGTASDMADPTKADEIFGLRADGGQLKYRVNKGSAVSTGIVNAVTVSDTLYKVYFTINLELGSMSITINDKPYLTDFTGVSFTSVEGFKFTSSDSGSKTLSVDYLIMTNMNMSVDEYKAKMKQQAQAEYDALNVDVEYPSNKTELNKVLTDALADIDAKTTISDIKKAYDTYLVNLDKAILTVQKQKLSQELETYVDKSLYTNEQLNKKDLETAIANGKQNITQAETYNQAVNALAEAKKVIDGIPTDDELLDVYKTEAIATLKAYKNSNDYTQHSTEYQKAITDGEAAIKSAQTIEKVDEALLNAKNALDAIETDSAYLDAIKANLCKELDDKVASIKANELADAQYASSVAQIETELANGKKNINAADTKASAENAKAEAVKKIELILSAALKTMAQFKEEAIAQLNTYATNAGTGYNDAALLNNIETARANGENAIKAVTGEDAAAKDAVLAALEDAKRAIDACIDEYTNGVSDAIVKQGQVEIYHYSGVYESAVLDWHPLTGATDYKVYVKGGSYADFTEADAKLCYIRNENGNYRADLLGLASGAYSFKVVPVINGAANEEASTICKTHVQAYDRSGYAHFNNTEGVGAYNDNGTLKDNAIVIYVTEDTKNTVELTLNGETIKGIGNILNTVGQECGEVGHEGQCKRVSGGKTYYGQANTNAGILKKLADANVPLVVRFVGCVSNTGLYKRGTFNASSTPLIEGLTKYNCYDWGGSEGDNGHMARMQSAKNVTLEGVGHDAVIDGWGFHFMCQSSNPDYGKNFEVRNLTFINTPEDAIGMEGIQEGNVITAGVERCWIHHNEFYCPNISSPAESDKSEGDGSCDFKRGQYFTCSYNYFEGCHKTNLVGSSDPCLQYNLTYHHNYWKNCQARGPLARQANIHMYNNVFEGQADYAMNTRANAYIYSEYNLFYTCKNPQRVDAGAIKSYKDSFSSTIEGIGTIVSDKSEVVSNPCAYDGIDYSKFDQDAKLSYIPTGDYELQESITEARKVIYAQTGVSKDTYIKPKNVTLNDLSYLPSGVTPVQVTTYPSTLTPGKISKTVYAFTIDRMASVTLDTGNAGVLVNIAGECFIDGNGVAVLEPGTYMVQAKSFSPGKDGAPASFKDMTINSIAFEEHDSAEFDAKLLNEYNTLASNIPANVTYDDNCYSAIKAAMNAYEALRDELKSQVTVPYSKVDDARLAYVQAGEKQVEDLIAAIGVVNENSGPKIVAARNAYNKLREKVPYVTVTNIQTLLDAEVSYREFAVTACINSINAIGEVTLEKQQAIQDARSQYELLGDEVQKKQVTNYQTLVDAEKKLADLIAANDINELITHTEKTDVDALKVLFETYQSLTDAQKQMITDKAKKSELLVAYTDALIAAIDSTVTVTSGPAISAANEVYESLTAEEKAMVADYAKLQKALEEYNKVAVESSVWKKEFADTEFEFTNANTGSTSGSTAVSVNNPTVLISKFKVTNLSKVVLSYTTNEKGASLVKVYYSTDGTNWTQFGSECKNGSNKVSVEHTLTATDKCIAGDVYIKIEGTCSKADSNAKLLTIDSLEIFAYGMITY